MKSKEKEEIKKQNTTRVILNVPNDIDAKFKEIATKRGIAKSNMILYAMSWYLDYNTTIDLLPKLLDTAKLMDIAKNSNEENQNQGN